MRHQNVSRAEAMKVLQILEKVLDPGGGDAPESISPPAFRRRHAPAVMIADGAD